jgi:toxin ParE1/3/4
MKSTVYLIEEAEVDLLNIDRYVAQNDSVEDADTLLDKLEETVIKLSTMSLRGHVPPELERIGVLEFREIVFKRYRIIYQIVKSNVYVHCILDGRRDLQDLLQLRVLR